MTRASRAALLCAGMALLVLGTLVPASRSAEAIVSEDGAWSRPVTPKNPLLIEKPKNWTDMGRAECPRECTSSGCCTAAWDQLGWLLLSMPKSDCNFCRLVRYTMGGLKFDNKTEKCKECLVDDFTQMVSNFRCNNDNGKCSKCCMDLTLIYLSRFVMDCPTPVWRRVADFNYKDTGFQYNGASTCPAPPRRNGTNTDPYDEEYYDSLPDHDPRKRVDWPRRKGEPPQGPGAENYVWADYGYTELHKMGVDLDGRK